MSTDPTQLAFEVIAARMDSSAGDFWQRFGEVFRDDGRTAVHVLTTLIDTTATAISYVEVATGIPGADILAQIKEHVQPDVQARIHDAAGTAPRTPPA